MLRHKSSIEQECLQVSREAVSGRLTFHARGASTHRRMSDLQVMDAGVVVVLPRSSLHRPESSWAADGVTVEARCRIEDKLQRRWRRKERSDGRN